MSAKDFPSRVHAACYGGKSDDPNAPENRENSDFLDGYAEGINRQFESKSRDPIADKYREIGEPEVLPDSFKEWKRGYNAASLRAAAGLLPTINERVTAKDLP